MMTTLKTSPAKSKLRNRYILVHGKLFWTALRNKKVTFRKLWNSFLCVVSFFFKTPRSAKAPMMVSIELSNDCQANCLFCRDEKGGIFDVNPRGDNSRIPKGRMPFEMAMDIIRQLKDDVLVAVLYTNGEPLVYNDLVKVIKFASQQGVISVIATNGLLLNEERGRELLEAGLDFIKIHLSGFTQATYGVQVRRGDVEQLKTNIRTFCRQAQAGRHPTLILLDYILYNYNRRELPQVQQFCQEIGLKLNVRSGNPQHGLEDREPALSEEKLPLAISCDWLWQAMQINWNGDILSCCEGAVFSSPIVYGKFVPQETSLLEVWNGPQARKMRQLMTKQGRGASSMCAQCLRKGISFKW